MLRPDNGLPWMCASAEITSPAGTSTAACDGDGWIRVPADTTDVVALGAFRDGVVSTTLFDDTDRDGRRDADEAPLAGWSVALVSADTHEEVARTTTDTTGVAGFVAPAGDYELVPMPPTATVPWVETVGTYAVTLGRARHVVTTGGWVQPGSVSVGVFHDLDQDSVREVGDVPLAERTVKLLHGTTGAVVATQLTDATGRAAFPATAGTTYRVSVDLPTGWRRTSPGQGAACSRRPA